MKKNNISVFLIALSISFSLILSGCYVGSRVTVEASDCDFPVSFTESLYDSDYNLIGEEDYEIKKEFSFNFSKWGTSWPLNIESDKDISKKLNDIIIKNGGDAIVDLQVSVSSSDVNGFFLFTKVISLWGAIIGTSVLISDGSGEAGLVAASSIAVYLLSPAAANVKVEGKVVLLLNAVEND
jgi:hypothetical protein